MRYHVASILLISCTIASGCASWNQAPPNAEQLQREALVRWQDCVDRVSAEPFTETIKVTSDLLNNRCEGHRRDVLMTFPVSMERELDALLRERARERVLRSAAIQIAR